MTIAAIYTKQACIYARFSSDLQKDRSIDDQFALCENTAKHDSLKIKARFSDRGKSGATMFERDGLIEMIRAAKDKKFDVLIVESLDRLSRDQEDLAGIYKRLTFYGVEIRTVNEGVVTPIHVGIRGLVGSLFLKDLGDKVRRGLAGRVREGKIPGAITYGYQAVAGGEKGEREINPMTAPIVRRIFTEYARGVSPRMIAAGLTRDGVPTPHGAPAWSHTQFVTGQFRGGLLTNTLYIGKLVWNNYRTVLNPETGKPTKRLAPAEDRITIDVPHLRIIDQDLWDAAQKVREGRGTVRLGDGKTKRQPMIARSKHLLAGLLRCGVCSGPMRISNITHNGQRVSCAAARLHGTCAHRKSYDLGRLQTLVLDGMRKHLTDPVVLGEVAKGFHDRWTRHETASRTEVISVRKRLNKVQVSLDRIVAAITSLDVPVAELTAKLKPLEAERAALTERLRVLEASRPTHLLPQVVEAYRVNVDKLHTALTGPGGVTDELRFAFQNLIDNIVVHQTGKCLPYSITPYGRLAALMGVDLFPSLRSGEEIVAEEGVAVGATAVREATLSHRYRIVGQIVCFGAWKEAA